MTDFDIEVQNEGCFGGSTDLFSVVKKENGFYYLKSNKTKKGHLVSGIKMNSLKNFLKTRIGKNEYGGCTVRQYIRIGSRFNSIDYENSFCSGIEATIINDLLNYYSLISDVSTSE
ncbi:hypothetical protein I2486_21430 [Cellulophaga sp. E16_2]|uniref:hypothetical protein n=1 Tax=Cellulophaga sp. E16_2 TaxID=2789297 RepID=UPI001A93604B|nr:hypothetical protein [Cellulophaga sp. E16_2]MBO0593970.1 hypothetical protein [Cellulophaga sp. E16_2]